MSGLLSLLLLLPPRCRLHPRTLLQATTSSLASRALPHKRRTLQGWGDASPLTADAAERAYVPETIHQLAAGTPPISTTVRTRIRADIAPPWRTRLRSLMLPSTRRRSRCRRLLQLLDLACLFLQLRLESTCPLALSLPAIGHHQLAIGNHLHPID